MFMLMKKDGIGKGLWCERHFGTLVSHFLHLLPQCTSLQYLSEASQPLNSSALG